MSCVKCGQGLVEGGVKNSPNIADFICTWPLKYFSLNHVIIAAHGVLKCYECLNDQSIPDLCEKDGVTQNLNECSPEVIGCTEQISEHMHQLTITILVLFLNVGPETLSFASFYQARTLYQGCEYNFMLSCEL